MDTRVNQEESSLAVGIIAILCSLFQIIGGASVVIMIMFSGESFILLSLFGVGGFAAIVSYFLPIQYSPPLMLLKKIAAVCGVMIMIFSIYMISLLQ